MDDTLTSAAPPPPPDENAAVADAYLRFWDEILAATQRPTPTTPTWRPPLNGRPWTRDARSSTGGLLTSDLH
ncbi:MAG TPA: hypothetical protein VGJ86_23520 [Acidimicrobiales bacterium]